MSLCVWTLCRLTRKGGGRCLFRRVSADQSEQTGLFRKDNKWSIQTEGELRCCRNGHYKKDISLKIKSCEFNNTVILSVYKYN